MDKRSDWMVGLIVKIKTSLGEEIEGEIFSFDSNTNSVVLFDILFDMKYSLIGNFNSELQSAKHTNIKKNWRILKTSFINEIQYVGKADTVDLELEPPPVNINKIRKQENKAIRLYQEEMSRIGVGVSEEAQEIFNALARTYLIILFITLICNVDYLVHGKRMQ
jgi:small nuclear ribonucleoprotein (snRNP)-like protein